MVYKQELKTYAPREIKNTRSCCSCSIKKRLKVTHAAIHLKKTIEKVNNKSSEFIERFSEIQKVAKQ